MEEPNYFTFISFTFNNFDSFTKIFYLNNINQLRKLQNTSVILNILLLACSGANFRGKRPACITKSQSFSSVNIIEGFL